MGHSLKESQGTAPGVGEGERGGGAVSSPTSTSPTALLPLAVETTVSMGGGVWCWFACTDLRESRNTVLGGDVQDGAIYIKRVEYGTQSQNYP